MHDAVHDGDCGDDVRLNDAGRYHTIGRSDPLMAMITYVIRSISAGKVNGDFAVRHPSVFVEMIVDEVPERAERLHHDQGRDEQQRKDTGTIRNPPKCHGNESITPRSHA